MQPGKRSSVSRRHFVKTAAVTAAAASVFPRVVRGAAPDKPIKVGLIGCGGRGTGAAHDSMNSAEHVKVTALADIFEEHIKRAQKNLKDSHGADIEDKNCFVGFDAYKKLLETDVDYVILATPPHYRPEHFPAAVAAGKHVFMEKPVAVDPVGVRKIMDGGAEANKKKLCVVAGTQRRHQNGYIETIRCIREGAIGNVVSAQCYWNGGQLWYKKREQGWSEMDWMHKDWVNWTWLSGDHIVEQHVHNLDVINWVLGKHPDSVVAMGGRARRITGNQYDYFSADLTYPGEIHVHSMCRQVNGCANNVSERVIGQDGWSNCNGFLSNFGRVAFEDNNPYVQEHADLIRAIRTGKPINEAQNVAESTMCAVMIRTSAYTGKEVTWREMMESDMELRAPTYELTEEKTRADIPVAGKP